MTKFRFKMLEVQITENGIPVFNGILENFVESFVHDEDYFLKDISSKMFKTFPKINTFWADTQKDITINFI